MGFSVNESERPCAAGQGLGEGRGHSSERASCIFPHFGGGFDGMCPSNVDFLMGVEYYCILASEESLRFLRGI